MSKKMMNMTVTATDIDWDAEKPELATLPAVATVKISVPNGSTTADIEQAVDEALAKEFGFYTCGYNYTFKRTEA